MDYVNILKVKNYGKRNMEKSGGYSSENIASLTIKMRTIFLDLYMI